MSHTTLFVSHDKLPLLKNALNTLRVEDLKIHSMLPSSEYATNISIGGADIANAVFNKYFDWDYYSNELEFE